MARFSGAIVSHLAKASTHTVDLQRYTLYYYITYIIQQYYSTKKALLSMYLDIVLIMRTPGF